MATDYHGDKLSVGDYVTCRDANSADNKLQSGKTYRIRKIWESYCDLDGVENYGWGCLRFIKCTQPFPHKEKATKIVALIHSSPYSPTIEAIEAILAE